MTGSGSWSYQVYCGPFGALTDCTAENFTYGYPSSALLDAVYEGVVHYDARREGECITALLAEECNGQTLFEAIPACAGVFTCPAGTSGGDAGTADGAASDGSSACSAFLFDTDPLTICTSDDDCANVTGSPQGLHCVNGFCTTSPCGLAGYTGCVSFAGVGQPCQEGATPTETCARGLVCQGATADGGLGACVLPQDVGGTCTVGTECKPGLVCGCGVCEIPPSTGPCVAGTCKTGVAYCDFGTNACRPGQRPRI